MKLGAAAGYRRLPNCRDKLFDKGFRVEGILGRGNNGLFAVLSASRGSEQVAVKTLDENNQEGTLTSALWREFEILRLLKHKNIVRALWFEGGTDSVAGSGIVMEFCPGVPLGRLMSWESNPHRVHMTMARRRDVLEEILSALVYLEEIGVDHRDLHAKNVLVANEERLIVKLLDFGSAKQIGSPIDEVNLHVDFNVSILPIGAHEPCDIFAAGLLATGLVAGRELAVWNVFHPRKAGPGESIHDNPVAKDGLSSMQMILPKPGKPSHSLTATAQRYLSSLLEADPGRRCSARVAFDTLPEASAWLAQCESGGKLSL